MSIIQTFYDNLASQYDKLFFNWQESTREQAAILNEIFLNKKYTENEILNLLRERSEMLGKKVFVKRDIIMYNNIK